MKRAMTRLLTLMLAALMAACATTEGAAPADFSLTGGGSVTSAPAPGALASGTAATDRALYSDLIRGMIAQGNYYAALAHIQEQQRAQGSTPELRYLEAETRRQLGQVAESERLYRGLLRSGVAGQAYHGLGLLYATRDLGRSIDYLKEAVARQPTDAQARNDLGYALTRAGRYGPALAELATAVELDPESDKARNNLVLLLILSGDEPGVKRIVRETGMTADALTRLRKQAQGLKQRGNAVRGG